MVGNPEQAQDLTQDTFVKAYRALPNVKELILPAWLYRIATNTALDALRHRKLIAWLPFQPGDDDRYRAPERDLGGEMAESEMVRQSLLALTPRQRACLLLRTRDGLSIDEICAAMKMSRDAVKATLYRGKERFRTAYRALECKHS
jgi:RNA polymerase sigma-70 factor (ECF subfamily)